MLTAPHVDWPKFHRDKADRFTDVMRSRNLDHAVVTAYDNFRWITDYSKAISFDSTNDYFAAIVDDSGDCTIIACDVDEDTDAPFDDMPWIKRSVAGPSWASFWTTHKGVYVDILVRELQAAGARRVGLEIAHFEVVEALRQALPDVVFEPVAGDLSEMRKLKMPVEVDLLEHAAKVSSLAMAAALNGAEEGATDREIVQLAIDAMYRNGAEWVSHHIVIVNTPDRQWSPGGKNFWKGDTVMLDLGAYAAGGYCGDLCRIHFVGEPPAAVADAYRVLLEAQNAGIAAAKPGVRCSELQQTIDDVLTKNGLRATPYAMGHGIGLKVMELPCIYRPEFMTYDDTLAAGMVICLEPSTFAEVDGRIIKVAHENTYEVVESGLRQLNPHSTALS